MAAVHTNYHASVQYTVHTHGAENGNHVSLQIQVDSAVMNHNIYAAFFLYSRTGVPTERSTVNGWQPSLGINDNCFCLWEAGMIRSFGSAWGDQLAVVAPVRPGMRIRHPKTAKGTVRYSVQRLNGTVL